MKYFAQTTLSTTAILAISGFVYYLLAPLNWGAGEYIMHFHLWLGIGFVFYFIFNITKHIKQNSIKIQNNMFKKVAYILLAIFSITLISGFLHFIPYISYFFTPIYYRFETYDFISNIHLGSSILLIALFFIHILLMPSKENK
jgi:hypothetical protein